MATGAWSVPDDVTRRVGRWAKIRSDGASITVSANYPDPRWSWVLAIFWFVVAQLFPLWLMLRLVAPELARYWLPGVDGVVDKIMTLPNGIAAHYINPQYNFDAGRGLDVVTGAGFLLTLLVVMLTYRIMNDRGWDLIILSKIIRTNVTVVFTKSDTTIRWSHFPRIKTQSFGVDEHSLVRNRLSRHAAFDGARSVVFVYDRNKMVIANVYGVERADGIWAALDWTNRQVSKLS